MLRHTNLLQELLLHAGRQGELEGLQLIQLLRLAPGHRLVAERRQVERRLRAQRS